MTNKDKFDAFMRLAEFRQSFRNLRYQTQMRLSVGLWAVLAGSIYLKVRPPGIPFSIVLMVVVFGHTIAVMQAAIANNRDLKYARYFANEAEKALTGMDRGRLRPPPFSELSFSERWIIPRNSYLATIIWVTPTILLSIGAYLLSGTIPSN